MLNCDIKLYTKQDFRRSPVFCVKSKCHSTLVLIVFRNIICEIIFFVVFKGKDLSKIPSLDYSNEEELNEDTRLMYEKYTNKMDESKNYDITFDFLEFSFLHLPS